MILLWIAGWQMKRRGLAFKLSILILSSSTAIFAAAFAYDYHTSKQTVLRNVEENARNLTLYTVHRIETVLHGVEKLPRNLASLIENYPYKREDIVQLAESAVANNSEIFGTAIAYEPHTILPEASYFAPYCYREANNRIVLTFLGSDEYRYFYMDWYQIPKELNHPVWSEPYYDEGGGNIVMATFSAPFYQQINREKRFQGVVTADVSLTWLTDIVSAVKIYQTGYAFLISQNGVFVTHPNSMFIMRGSIFSIAESRGDQHLRRIGRNMLAGGEGLVPLKDFASGAKSWMYFAPLPSSGWSIGVIFPEDELFADIRHLSHQVILIGLAGFILLFIAIAAISGTITRPLRHLDRTTREIAKGNLDIELPEVSADDEIGRLTRSFGSMKVALKEYISNLAATTAAKERIESELKIARTIQMSFLPKHFPPFPEKDAFEIYAALEPAREIGGDLYDFFLLDQDHLFFAVGDVSDKGIPAALFMAVSKTLLKGMAEAGMEPSEILNKVNVELCRDNDSMMFVTVFCGILNFRSGELTYSNAGHEPPALVKRGQPPQWLEIPAGFLLGVNEASQYRTAQARLEPGDLLFVYTDGVTEAMNADQALYSNERLLQTVQAHPRASAEQIVKAVMDSVKEYASGVPQSDDITALAVQFKAFQK
jgi:phosphoserine phosphatase RsbU/P